jgi:histidinol-phosphatase (PHP family)
MIDSHMHLQQHGEKPPMTRERLVAYVERGLARGVERICITEHLFRFEEAYDLLHGWWDEDRDPQLRSLAAAYWKDHVSGSVADYVRLIEDAKSDALPVLLGLEMDWLHGHEDELRAFLAPYDWDIVLGSIHWIGAWGLDEVAEEWERRDVAEQWERYGDLARELAESRIADVLTHPDLPKVFGHRPADETPLHDRILEGAVAGGIALELNSNGLHNPARELYPAPPLLERAHALGVPITFASDAHVPERVGENFDLLVDLARRAGYSEASSFVERRRTSFAI